MQLMSSSCLCLETSLRIHMIFSPLFGLCSGLLRMLQQYPSPLPVSKIIPGFSNHFCHFLAFLPPDPWSSVRPCRRARYAVINNLIQALTSSAHHTAAFCSISARALWHSRPLKHRSFGTLPLSNCIKCSKELGAHFLICGSCFAI